MQSAAVIERLREKIPNIRGDSTVFGITQLDIECSDGSIKQFVLLFERLRVDEPSTLLRKNQIYADVLIRICDEVLMNIASKVISIDEAINKKLFRVYGDAEIWTLQLAALRKILPNEDFAPPTKPDTERNKQKQINTENWIDYANLPPTDLSNVPEEFKALTEHFASLREKYSTKKVDRIAVEKK